MRTKILLIIIILLTIGSCSEKCYDCYEIVIRKIIVEDSENNNLIFGENPTYKLDSIKLIDKNGKFINIIENIETKSLDFGLESYHDICFLHLDSIEIDTISFDLYQENGESCCGQVSYSSKTYLNNVEIENSTIIKIIK